MAEKNNLPERIKRDIEVIAARRRALAERDCQSSDDDAGLSTAQNDLAYCLEEQRKWVTYGSFLVMAVVASPIFVFGPKVLIFVFQYSFAELGTTILYLVAWAKLCQFAESSLKARQMKKYATWFERE